jgi:hypothetical protein
LGAARAHQAFAADTDNFSWTTGVFGLLRDRA